MSTNRSGPSLSSGDLADVSSMSQSSSGGLRRSVTRCQRQNVEPVAMTAPECSRAAAGAGVAVSSAHTTPGLEQQSAGQRRSSSILSVLSSRPDSGGRASAVRQRSSSSLFSEDNVDVGLASHRTSADSTNRQSTSSNERTSIFRLPFPKRDNRRSSSLSTAPSLHSPPQRASRLDFCPASLRQFIVQHCIVFCYLP